MTHNSNFTWSSVFTIKIYKGNLTISCVLETLLNYQSFRNFQPCQTKPNWSVALTLYLQRFNEQRKPDHLLFSGDIVGLSFWSTWHAKPWQTLPNQLVDSIDVYRYLSNYKTFKKRSTKWHFYLNISKMIFLQILGPLGS